MKYFTLCKINEVHLISEDTKTSMPGRPKIKLASMDRMKTEQIMELVPLEQLQGTYREAR